MKVCGRIDTFEKASFPDCIWGIDSVSACRTFPIPIIIKQKACKFTLQAILIMLNVNQ